MKTKTDRFGTELTVLAVYVPLELRKKLDELCRSHKRTLSDLVNEALDDYVRKEEPPYRKLLTGVNGTTDKRDGR